MSETRKIAAILVADVVGYSLALAPTFTVCRVPAAWTAMNDDPTYLAQLESIFDGLRKAGMPEQ